MILDTNAVSAILAGEDQVATVLADEDRHHLPAIVLGEYRYGLLRSRYRGRLEFLLETLEKESTVLSIDGETSSHYALVREALRRRGRPIPENDVWIASLARQHQLRIVSRDEHFDEVEGIVRVGF